MNDEAGSPPAPAGLVAPARRWRTGEICLALAVLVYGLGYLIWYLSTPLGRAPQLDAAENLALAGKIAAGTLAHEPFYRAMLYPAVLAIPLTLGWPVEWLAALASTLGLLCHFAITWGVARMAARLWAGPRSRWAAMLAAALWGLNPVALFYAVDVLDVVPSLALFVVGLLWWTHSGLQIKDAIVGGVFLGLAVAARPHFLTVVLIAPIARAWLAGRWRIARADLGAWAGAGAVLLVLGCGQLFWSGKFRILPWQGSYNFYSANRAGANGRYYVQQMFFQELAPGENPARWESEILYDRATSKTGPLAIDDMNDYWRQQGWAAIKANPGAWLKLMGRKLYYLLNDFDQYNNKTYAWQQEQSPWLRWNYLGWGLLFVLGVGAVSISRQKDALPTIEGQGAMLAGVALVFCAYAGGVLLYYASGRFRLPLAPLLCGLAGGWAVVPGLSQLSPRKVLLRLVVIVLAAMVAWTNFFDAHDTSTFIQDEMLTANAAAAVGEDAQAYQLAQSVLTRDATREDARRVAAVSYFNLSLGEGSDPETLSGWQEQVGRLAGLDLSDPTLALVAGVAQWKTGHPTEAEIIWQNAATRFGPGSMPAQALTAAQNLRGEAAMGNIPADPQLLVYLKKMPPNAAN